MAIPKQSCTSTPCPHPCTLFSATRDPAWPLKSGKICIFSSSDWLHKPEWVCVCGRTAEDRTDCETTAVVNSLGQYVPCSCLRISYHMSILRFSKTVLKFRHSSDSFEWSGSEYVFASMFRSRKGGWPYLCRICMLQRCIVRYFRYFQPHPIGP